MRSHSIRAFEHNYSFLLGLYLFLAARNLSSRSQVCDPFGLLLDLSLVREHPAVDLPG